MVCDPLGDLRAWQDRLERLALHNPEPWAPPMDLYETESAYILTVEAPGLTRDEIVLSVEDSRVTIRGARAERRPSDVVHYHQVERGTGLFARTFEFAGRLDGNGVTADLADGVLTVTLPKMPPPPPRRIDVG